MKVIVHNLKKGIILDIDPKEDFFNVIKKANYEFYSPFLNKKELNCCEVFEEGKNWIGFQNFSKVVFQFSGENGCGRVTQYDTNIYTQPDESQKKFMGECKIDSIIFY